MNTWLILSLSSLCIFIDAINIFNNGMYVENISVINEFTNSSNLTLTCTTIDGLGGPLWNMLSESGNAVVQNLLNISYMYSVLSLSDPTNDFAARFSCRSLSNSSLYKEVLITTGTHIYYRHMYIGYYYIVTRFSRIVSQ